MDHDDIELEIRLAALEARAPSVDRPPALPARRRRGRFAVSMAMAPVLALAVVATTAAGVIVSNLVQAAPGIQNPGEPLAGAHMECMTPREAKAFLAEHGFISVLWQVESGSVAPRSGKTVVLDSPPEHGFVIPGSILGGQLHMIIDQRVGASGVGDCYGQPMP